MKKKSYIIILILFLLLISCIILIYKNGYNTKEKCYYVPQMGMYIKIIWKPNEEIGLILFSKNDNFSENDNTDHIKVSKNINTNLVVNPNEKNKIYVEFFELEQLNQLNQLYVRKISNIVKINQIKYKIIDGIADTDTTYYEKRNLIGSSILKYPFLKISISPYFESVSLKKSGERNYTKLKSL